MAKSRVYEYEGEEIRVSWDSGRCIHAEKCVHGLPEVFDPNRRPWIDPDREPPARVAEVIRRCPTGALHYSSDSVAAEEPAEKNSVRLARNGPLYLRGRIRLEGADGDWVHEDTRVALCRCGQSKLKPFCDGTHTKVGWKS